MAVSRAALALGIGCVVSVLAAAGAEGGNQFPAPTTLVRGGMIEAFAQDGDRIVWAEVVSPSGHDLVRVRDLRSGRTWRLGNTYDQRGELPAQHVMALAGRRALWVGVFPTLSHYECSIYAGGVDRRQAVLGYGCSEQSRDEPFRGVPVAGDGATLVYASSGSVWRVPGGRVAGPAGVVGVAANTDAFAAARAVPAGCVCIEPYSVSPDGREILYGGSPPPVRGGGLSVTDLLGHERQLAVSIHSGRAVWAPDSRRLAFVADSEPLAVDLLDVEGGARTRLFSGDRTAWLEDLSWSPDGRYLAVYDARPPGQTFVIAVAGGARHVIAGRFILWSPDSAHLAGVSDSVITVVAADGSESRGLMPLPKDFDPAALGLAWRDPATLAAEDRDAVWVLPIDGSDPRVLLNAGSAVGYQLSPNTRWAVRRGALLDLETGQSVSLPRNLDPYVWSPDSRHLYALDMGVPGGQMGSGAVIDIPGGKVTPLKGLWVYGWLPDSKTLYGTFKGEIATVGRDGTGLRQLTHTRIAKAWSGVEVRRTRDGRLLSRFTTPTPVRSLALSASRVAVLADNTHKGTSIDLYSRGGKLLRSVKVNRSADNISISGHWILFASRGAIDVVDTDTGEIRSVSRVQHLVNATIDGHRIAWAEQHEDGTSLIRALELP